MPLEFLKLQSLLARLLPQREEVLVYSRTLEAAACQQAAGVTWLTPEDLPQLFADEPALARKFARFLKRGYLGVAVVQGGRWLSYAWMTTPASPQAVHLPAALAGHYWVFYCHTRASERGKGLLRRCLEALLQEASRREPAGVARVYADIRASNGPSRKAFMSLGFAPCGTLATLRVAVLVLGRWMPEGLHQPLVLG